MSLLLLRPVRAPTLFCIFNRCMSPRYSRGLCKRHYDRARYIVKLSLDTWDDLVARGQALPKRVFRDKGAKGQRIREAIIAIHARGKYPSASKICRELGRSSKALRGDECNIRHEVFEELGIAISHRGPSISFGSNLYGT